MSTEQCHRCLYRDRLVRDDDGVWCPVHEGRAQQTCDCPDFEDEDEDEGRGKPCSN
jgi:hypothetical protein